MLSASRLRTVLRPGRCFLSDRAATCSGCSSIKRLQSIGEEVVIAIPLAPVFERNHKQVGAIEIFQGFLTRETRTSERFRAAVAALLQLPAVNCGARLCEKPGTVLVRRFTPLPMFASNFHTVWRFVKFGYYAPQ